MMSNLINDLLDQAKLEAGTFTFNEDYFDLIDVINNSIDVIRYLADEKKIQVSLEFINFAKPLDTDVPDLELYKRINGDENRYTQILLNFLSKTMISEFFRSIDSIFFPGNVIG